MCQSVEKCKFNSCLKAEFRLRILNHSFKKHLVMKMYAFQKTIFLSPSHSSYNGSTIFLSPSHTSYKYIFKDILIQVPTCG